jgi:hypothetical protein
MQRSRTSSCTDRIETERQHTVLDAAPHRRHQMDGDDPDDE